MLAWLHLAALMKTIWTWLHLLCVNFRMSGNGHLLSIRGNARELVVSVLRLPVDFHQVPVVTTSAHEAMKTLCATIASRRVMLYQRKDVLYHQRTRDGGDGCKWGRVPPPRSFRPPGSERSPRPTLTLPYPSPRSVDRVH